MFSLQPRDELVFGPNENVISEPDRFILRPDTDIRDVQTNFIPGFSIDFTKSDDATANHRGQKKHKNIESSKKKIRRVSRTDIERKRRQEMSKLYATLGSFLPGENLKGKRSVGDHVQEAVNFIKSLQENVEKFRTQRDKLKKRSLVVDENRNSNCRPNRWPNSIRVNVDPNSLEILILHDKFELRECLRN